MNTSTHALDSVQLGHTITRMDALAQSGFSTITELTRKAIEALESAVSPDPTGAHVVGLLQAVWSLSDCTANDINVMAETVGINT